MPSLSFQKEFAAPIIDKRKRHTIRGVSFKPRARRFVAGDRLYMFTGMRTKHCRRIGEAGCTDVLPIALDLSAGRVNISGRPLILRAYALDLFAVSDGFEDWAALKDFWWRTHQVDQKWSGVIIEWGDTFVPA